MNALPAAGGSACVGQRPRCGVGLRKEHADHVLAERPAIPLFEAISENFMVDGGRPLEILEAVRRDYPVALHGVSLSIGSADPLDARYLRRLADLVRRIQPVTVSDHLCWTSLGGHNSHDLLPLPRTEEVVYHCAARVQRVQEYLGRPLLLENISTYVEFRDSTLSEPEFLAAVAEEADCALLLDVNNLYVNARNHGFDPFAALAALPADRILQYHLAGHEDHGDLVIDTHDHPVREEVFALFAAAVRRFGPRPAIIEWDAQIPPFDVLATQAAQADAVMAANALAPRAMPPAQAPGPAEVRHVAVA